MERMKDVSDKVLLFEIAENNDEDAFRILFDRYSERIFNLLYRMVQHYEDANDLLQEVFIRVYNNRSKCYRMKNFKGWIYTVALNLGRDYIRLHKRRHEEEFNEMTGKAPVRNDPLENTQNEEIKKKILIAANRLNPKYRAVFMLRDIEGMTYDEISKILNIEKGTVKSRLNRARLKLARVLEGNL